MGLQPRTHSIWRADMISLLLTTLLSTTILPVQAQQQCYFPNGSPSNNDSPCNTAGSVNAHCCNNQSLCLSNGFCQSATFQPWALSRGSCTDQSWGASCPSMSRDNPGGGVDVVYLGRDGNGNAQYCCGIPVASSNNKVVCPNSEPAFTLPNAAVLFGRAFLADTTQGSASSSDGNSNGENINGTAAVAGPSPAVIGAGVGIPLAVLAVTMCAWAVWERKKRKKEVTVLKEQMAAGNGVMHHMNGSPENDYKPGYPQPGQYTSPVQSHRTGSTLPVYPASSGPMGGGLMGRPPQQDPPIELGNYRQIGAHELQ